MKSVTLAALALTVASVGAMSAQATTVNVADTNTWHPFDVDPITANDSGLEWIDINDGTALDFKINLTQAAFVTVVDGGFAGDQFQVFDNGVSLGLTSTPTNTLTSVGLNFNAALANQNYSRATFYLSAGSHDITGLLTQSALDNTGTAINATVGALEVTAVPLPGTGLLFLSGGGLLTLAARRRRTV